MCPPVDNLIFEVALLPPPLPVVWHLVWTEGLLAALSLCPGWGGHELLLLQPPCCFPAVSLLSLSPWLLNAWGAPRGSRVSG